MSNIIGFFHVNSTDVDYFNESLHENISKLQNDGQEIEIQYTTNVLPNGQLVYNALMLGRK